MAPTNLHEFINLLNQIASEHGGETLLEFQDIDWEERNVDIFLENIVNYTDSSESSKKLIIRQV